MSALTNLKLVSAKRPAQLSPILQRRNKLSNKLWEQIQLATARKDGISYAPTKLRSVINDETGETTTIEVPKRMREWWFMSDAGKLCLCVKYGAKTLTLGSKNQTAVELTSADQLIPTLTALKQAVEAGELDAQIEAVSGAVKANFKK